MTHEQTDQFIRFGRAGHRVLQRVITIARAAEVGLLIGIECRIDCEAVLEVVDAEGDGLRVSDGAEVAGDFESALVRFRYGGTQLVARNVLIGLERRYAAIGPISDGLPRIIDRKSTRLN